MTTLSDLFQTGTSGSGSGEIYYITNSDAENGTTDWTAATGGVIGIGFFKLALCGETLQDLVSAIVYTVDLAGIDHVGLGSDYDGLINAIFDSSGFSILTEALLEEGFSQEDIAKIMGGNTLRVLMHNLPDETLDINFQ